MSLLLGPRETPPPVELVETWNSTRDFRPAYQRISEGRASESGVRSAAKTFEFGDQAVDVGPRTGVVDVRMLGTDPVATHVAGLAPELVPVGELPGVARQQLAIDLYLMSAGAWAIAEGVTVPEADTALLKRAVLEVSHRSLLLADSTKLGAYERYRVAPLNRLDVVVTDDRISAEAVAGIRNLGPEVELVSA